MKFVLLSTSVIHLLEAYLHHRRSLFAAEFILTCWCPFLILQAEEFFPLAQRSATAQQRELEAQHIGEGSIDSPLLLEQVMLGDFDYIFFSLNFCWYFVQANSSNLSPGNDNGSIKASQVGFFDWLSSKREISCFWENFVSCNQGKCVFEASCDTRSSCWSYHRR